MGAKRQNKIRLAWSPGFAYALGLIATDGCLSKDGRHLDLTSKDQEIVEMFRQCLGLENRIGLKARGYSHAKKYFRIQFGDIAFYEFLLTLGFMPAKSKIIGPLKVPRNVFPDFLRGCIDGDGSLDVHSHPESRHPQIRTRLSSASLPFLKWIKDQVNFYVETQGGWIDQASRVYVLSYAKADSLKVLQYISYDGVTNYLKRKHNIIKNFLPRWRNWETRKA